MCETQTQKTIDVLTFGTTLHNRILPKSRFIKTMLTKSYACDVACDKDIRLS